MSAEGGYFIGQVVRHEPPRGIVAGPETAPVWHALIVPPQKELAVRKYLRARDIYAFFPSETKVRHDRGKRIERERPIVARHVYAQFRQAPQWDVMKRRERLITGVYCNGAIPVVIPSEVIRHLQGLTVEAQRLKEARAEMLRVRAGDRATIAEGPLAGFMVDVTEVKGGVAWFEFLTGARASADLRSLERIVPSGDQALA